MPQIHACARTTPAVRIEIARSEEPTGVLARRYGVSAETVRKWRKRGPKDCLDHSDRPRKLPWRATERRALGPSKQPSALGAWRPSAAPAAASRTRLRP